MVEASHRHVLTRKIKKSVFLIRFQLNPDPGLDLAKNPNPDPDPSYFFTLSENSIKLLQTYTILSSKQSIERYNAVKSKLFCVDFTFLAVLLSPWIRIRRTRIRRIRIQKAPEYG